MSLNFSESNLSILSKVSSKSEITAEIESLYNGSDDLLVQSMPEPKNKVNHTYSVPY